ncbi:hypothetical protein [Rhodopirellula sp. MGV]|uniref:hypothetical protein n=1 Tax=Rhodopirellula sp. MGV TaxID=2023130 RepID=UPI001179A8A3|nr:hypothetical protein [Rhodopirellula sp. MGV]
MLFGPTQPDLVQPTDAERKLVADAEERIAERTVPTIDGNHESATFSWFGMGLAIASLLLISLLVFAIFTALA